MIKVQRVAIEISVKKRCRLVVVVDCALWNEKVRKLVFLNIFLQTFHYNFLYTVKTQLSARALVNFFLLYTYSTQYSNKFLFFSARSPFPLSKCQDIEWLSRFL